MELGAKDKEAIDLYWLLRRLGAEVVFGLRPLRLTEYEAEELLARLSAVAASVEAFEKQQEHERLQAMLTMKRG